MTDDPRPSTCAPPDDALEVALYLRSHPHFLDDHPEVLAALEIPHHTPGAISLVGRQLAALRDEKRKLREQIETMTRTAEDNQRTLGRLHRLACRLLAIPTVNRAELEAVVSEELGLDRTRLVLSQPNTRIQSEADDQSAFSTLRRFFPERPVAVCRILTSEDATTLFEDPRAYSCAFIPLEKSHGWAILGARDPERFHPGLGTLFLAWLGDILDARLCEI